jgi:hypothetical protein
VGDCRCIACGRKAHVDCWAQHLRKDENGRDLPLDVLLPQRGTCPSCSAGLRWLDVLLKSETVSGRSRRRRGKGRAKKAADEACKAAEKQARKPSAACTDPVEHAAKAPVQRARKKEVKKLLDQQSENVALQLSACVSSAGGSGVSPVNHCTFACMNQMKLVLNSWVYVARAAMRSRALLLAVHWQFQAHWHCRAGRAAPLQAALRTGASQVSRILARCSLADAPQDVLQSAAVSPARRLVSQPVASLGGESPACRCATVPNGTGTRGDLAGAAVRTPRGTMAFQTFGTIPHPYLLRSAMTSALPASNGMLQTSQPVTLIWRPHCL